MKRFILLLSFIVGLTTAVYSQSSQVSFIHGLGDNATVWNPIANQLSADFDFVRDDVTYNSNDAISTSASSVFIPSGTVSVAHSLGGLLARDYLRQGGTNQMKALITVGTPNLGAPAAENVQNGVIAAVIGGWIEDLAAGPAASLGSLGGRQFAEQVLEEIGYVQDGSAQLLNAKLQSLYGQQASVNDMKPGSSFLSTLNSSPNSTLPSARYAIFGNESASGLEYVRLAESANNDRQTPIESGVYVRYHRGLSAFYAAGTSFYSILSARYFYLYATSDTTDPLYFSYYDNAVYFATLARQWFRGFLSLVYYQQRDWDKYVVGVNYYSGSICGNSPNCKDANDGLLTAISQSPSFFNKSDNIERRLPAIGANHLEETAHPAVRQRLKQVFENADVNIPEYVPDEPLSVTVSGPPYLNDGQTAYFSSNVSNSEGAVSYQWYYRQEPYASWVSGGTGSSFQRTFYSAPGGETAHSSVKLEITSAGESASDTHSFDVYGCSGMLTQSVGTNAIIPC